MIVVNRHGRRWEEFDAIRAQALIAGSFALVSEDGVPLCGRVIEGQEPITYTAQGRRTDLWYLHPAKRVR